MAYFTSLFGRLGKKLGFGTDTTVKPTAPTTTDLPEPVEQPAGPTGPATAPGASTIAAN